MTNPELHSLLRECKDDPDDDVPRLVLADWLDDHGEADRAEFVRFSVRLSAGEIPLGDEAVTLARLNELYSRNADRWLGGMRKAGGRVCFDRGLIRLSCGTATLHALDAATPPDVIPWLETLAHDRRSKGRVVDLPSLAALRHFSGLDLASEPLTGEMLECFAADLGPTELRRTWLGAVGSREAGRGAVALCRQLRGLRVLDLTDGVGDDALASMARGPWLSELSTLALRRGGAIDKGVEALADSHHAPRLRHLSLDGARARGLRLLAASPVLGEVVTLRLEQPDNVRALAGRTEWRRLRRLELRLGHLENQGIRALAEMQMPALRRLTVADAGLTPAGLREILAAPWCAGLEVLDLTGNGELGDAAAQVMAGAASLANLRDLRLEACGLTAEGVWRLANGQHLARLQTLDLRDNSLGTVGLAALAAGDWPQLTALGLRLCQATIDGVARLTRSPLAGRLRFLDLSDNRLADEGLAALASSRLGERKDLRLTDLNCTPQGAGVLARAPFVGLVRLAVRTATPLDQVADALLSTHGFPSLAMLHAPKSLTDWVATRAAVQRWPRLGQLARLELAYAIDEFPVTAPAVAFPPGW